MSLQGKHVVIVGGTSGIGLAVAERAARDGAAVTVVSRRQESVDAAVAQLGPNSGGHTVAILDTDAVQALFASIGDIDHLVYTAGEALSLMPIESLDLDQARGFFQTRYFGALNAVHAAAPRIRAGGSVTLTSGSASQRPGPGWAVAASVCGAMEGLTRALAVELAPIRVNAVAPGVVRSPLWAGLSDDDREAMYAGVGASLPVARIGEVEDIAQAYIYCMTQGYGTGAIIGVDGGSLLV